ncbi:hypothetical protein LT330_002571 [Penicillium expansum]|nr:hypothetical protein LT330_002571 [Penicillium expansum]
MSYLGTAPSSLCDADYGQSWGRELFAGLNNMSYRGIALTSLCEADYDHDMWFRYRENSQARAVTTALYAITRSCASARVIVMTTALKVWS